MNEINLEKTQQELKDRGIKFLEQGLFIDVPRIFSIPPEEDDIVLVIKLRVPATFPILSFDTRREIERNSQETLTGYSIDVRALYSLTPVEPKSRKEAVWGQDVYVDFGYYVGEDNWDWSLLSFEVNEAVILRESSRLTTCDRFWAVRVNSVPVTINYVITTINDAKTPIYRTNVVRKTVAEDGQLYTYIDVQNHEVYEHPRHTPASSIAEAIATGSISKERYRTCKRLKLFGIGIPFPLDKNCSFHFIFA